MCRPYRLQVVVFSNSVAHVEIPACTYHLLEDVRAFKDRHKQNLRAVVEGYITLLCECEQNSRDLSRLALQANRHRSTFYSLNA